MINLRLGGVGVTLLHDPALAEPLAPFLRFTGPAPSPLYLEMGIDPALDGSRPYDLAVTLQGDRLEAASPGLRLRVDLGRGGDARLAPGDPDEPGTLASNVENAFRVLWSQLLLRHGLLFLHATAVLHPEAGLLVFFGRSGVGKSTLARLAEAAGLPTFSDDILVVDPRRGVAHSTPFRGGDYTKMRTPASAPVQRMWWLAQGPQSRVEPLGRSRRVAALIEHSLASLHLPGNAERVWGLAAESRIPFERLVLKKPASWQEVWEVIA